MENVLEFKGFQELNHDELMFVDGGSWANWGNAVMGTLVIASTPIVAVIGGAAGGPLGALAAASGAVALGSGFLSNIRF